MQRTFTLIGGGLAGTFLSYQLVKAGQQVLLIDDKSPKSASRVAAGLFNVVTGRYGTKSWMVDELLPYFKNFIHKKENHSLLPFVHELPIYRPFKEIREYNKWLGKASRPAYQKWVRFHENPLREAQLENPLGGVEIRGCGWTETGKLIEAMQSILHTYPNFSFIQDFIPSTEFDLQKRKFRYAKKLVDFDQLILCAGHHSHEHALWQGIPIIPNKGELLLIEAPELELDFIFSRKIYLIPRPDQHYIVGSTYENTFSDPHPSDAARAEICAHLNQAIKVPYKVLDQRAGIRPTTPDRKPILGTHPLRDFVHVFTGFGTKGVLLAPWFSEIMANYLLHNKSLPEEVDIKRFEEGN